MHAAFLNDRGVVKVAGEDARGFLNSLITCDISKLEPRDARFGALLSPQGKLLFDFFVVIAPGDEGGGFYLDCPRPLADGLARKLALFKLRAKLSIEDISSAVGVVAVWGGGKGLAELDQLGLAYADPRAAALGFRIISERGPAAALEGFSNTASSEDYNALRISQGIPQGGIDFIYGDAFPHEANMDLLGGIDFAKGCFVGQEIVSRMQHRGTARTRIVLAAFEGGFGVDAGAEVKIGERVIGRAGSTANGLGLLMLRVDRALEAGAQDIHAGNVKVTLTIPDSIIKSLKPAGRAGVSQ